MEKKRLLKRSKAVPLVLLGTMGLIAVSGCDDQQEAKQNQYRSLEDCRRDWGTDPNNCRIQGSGSSFVYLGPRYYYDRSAGVPMAIEPSGVTRPITGSYISRGVSSSAIHTMTSTAHIASPSVARGGFGAHATSISGGG
jgi:uncharacterized protein YgiB involved in biofilm formation